MSAITVFSATRHDDEEDFVGEDAKATCHALSDWRPEADHPAGIAIEIETPRGKLYEVVIAEDQLIAALSDIARFREEHRADIFQEPYCKCDGDC